MPQPPNGETALAIICGGGSLPFALADAAHAARPPRGAVRAARMGRSASRRGLSAPLDLDRPVRPFHADCRARKAAATSPSSARWCGLRSGTYGPTCGALRLMPQLVQTVPRRRRSPAVGHRPAVRAARLPPARAQGHRAGACRCRTGRSAAARRASATAPTSRAGLPCSTPPVRSTSARPWSLPTIRCSRSRARKAPTGCWRAWRELRRERPHPHAGRRRRAGQGRRSSARTIASTCRRSDRAPSRPPRRAGLAGIAVVAGIDLRRRARAHRRRGRPRQDFRRRRRSPDGPHAMTGTRRVAGDEARGEFEIFLVAAEESGDRLGARADAGAAASGSAGRCGSPASAAARWPRQVSPACCRSTISRSSAFPPSRAGCRAF